MNFNRIASFAAASAALGALTAPASAQTNYIITGTFLDGGTINGTFTVDPSLATLTSYAPVTRFSITTTAGTGDAALGYSYSNTNGTGRYSVIGGDYISITNPYDSLVLGFVNPLQNGVGDTLDLSYSDERFQEGTGIREFASGNVTVAPAPEPCSIMLVLGALGVVARRRRG